MKKETVGNYLSGVKHMLSIYGQNVDYVNNLAVTKILTGMHLLDAVAGKQPDQKKPFPLEMTRYMVDVLLRMDTVWNKMMRVAALMAYFLLLHQSEYIWQNSKSDHALRVRHVEFKLRARDEFIDASAVSNVLFSDIESVKITLPHCKNDPFRRGNQF
jgi:hypothetical protein